MSVVGVQPTDEEDEPSPPPRRSVRVAEAPRTEGEAFDPDDVGEFDPSEYEDHG